MKIRTKDIVNARKIEETLTHTLTLEAQEFEDKIENRYNNKNELEEVLHDIKNPLTAIKLSLENIAGDLSSKNINLALEGATEIERITFNKSNRKKFNVCHEIKTVNQYLNNRININLIGKCSSINGDALKLRRVIQNILVNSLEENRSQNKTKVDIQIQDNEKEIQIVITDKHKIKNPQNKQNIEKVFNKWYSHKDKSNNKGLGLYICKKIIEKDFNGRISAKINKNLQFSIKIVIPIV